MSIHTSRIPGTLKYGVVAVATAALTVSVAPAAMASDSTDTFADQIVAAQTGPSRAGAPTKAIEKAYAHTQERKAMSLESKPGYHVYDSYYDGYDSYAYPELLASSGAVSTSSPDKFMVVGLTDTYTMGSTSAGLLIDANNDGTTDFSTATPSYTYLDTGYTTSIYRSVNGSLQPTGQTATWLRMDEAYGVSIPWRALGVQNVRWTMGVIDSYGDSDFSPDDYGQVIDLMAGQYPPPPPAPAPGPTAPATTSKKPSAVSLRVKKYGKRTITARWTKSTGAAKYGVELRRNGNSRWYDTKSRTKTWRNLKPGKYVVKVWPVSKDLTSGSTSSYWIRVK